MAVFDQPVTTYGDTLAQVRVISDVISMIDPRDTPTLAALGLDSARSKFKINMNGTKVEWLEDALDPLTSTLAKGATETYGTEDTSFKVSDASVFQDGHVILVDSEYMVVQTASATDNTIAVYSRTYGGTNATHDGTAAITIVGMARLEGDDADYGPVVTLVNPYNYTSIFQKGIKVTGTEEVISQYGKSDEFAYQANKAMPHLLRLVNRMAFHGVRSAGSATTVRSAGGLPTFLTGNSVNAGGAIAKTDIDNVAEYVYADGGYPDLFICNHAVANDLRALIDSSSFVRVTQENTQFGMAEIRRLVTQYGEMRILSDRHCPVATAYAVDTSKIGFYTLRSFRSYPLARTGDSVKGEVIGEIGLCVAHGAEAHGYVYGLTS
jgi:hypothetical protein